MQDNVSYNIKKSCRCCKAIFQSSVLDDTSYCKNCREDEDASDVHSSERDYDDIVNNSCRTSPVFYD